MIGINKALFLKIKPQGQFSMDFKNKLNGLIKNLKKNAENYVSDNQCYRNINEHISVNSKNIKARSLAMTISQDETHKSQHLLEISMLHPTMMLEIKRPLAMGNKAEILNYLNKVNVNDLIKNDITEMSTKLSNK